MAEFIVTSRPRPGVLLIGLNRPRQMNALSGALLVEVASELAAAEDDEEVRCVVLTGNENVFSAGADIKEMLARGLEAIDNPERQSAWNTIESFRKPLIAAVTGLAFGGGHELVMLADIVIAADNARFAQPEINIGILPGDGATQRLTRVVGKSMAMRLVLTGEAIDAATAQDLGLVAEVVPPAETLERALELAATIATKPPIAARLAKQAVLSAYETTLSAGLAVEREAIRLAFETADREEGMRAFAEKRAPKFTGR